ncbi:MAG: hypothetical protein JRH20_23545 [Deltaproteobacteria bacterium]|nr:hypothetical protein [Deltaproteobacteria bacterium]
MHKLSEHHSFNITANAMRHLQLRLAGRQDAESVSQLIEGELEALKAAFLSWEKIQDRRVAGTSEMRFWDDEIDFEVRALSHRLLAEFGSRDDARYRKVFFRPASEITEGIGERQQRFLSAMLNTLTQDPAYTGYKIRIAKVARAHEMLQKTGETRKGIWAEETQAKSALEIALDQAKRAYNRAHLQLQLTIDNERMVESFFKPLYRKGSVESSEEANLGDARQIDEPSA